MSATALRGAVAAVAASGLLSGCAGVPSPPPDMPFASNGSVAADRIVALLPADALLLGEQHDAPEHHRIEREAVEALASRGALAAVALEMADSGRSTRGLGRKASEADARAALGWSEDLWPWRNYSAAVMAALRAGVPVVGANLPREQMRAAMADAGLDALLSDDALAAQRQAIRSGHCDLLPESRVAPMTRIQLARDRAMARAIEDVAQPGKTVLLIAGAGHVRRDLGIPLHLSPRIGSKVAIALSQQSPLASDLIAKSTTDRPVADRFLPTPALPQKDHCAALR